MNNDPYYWNNTVNLTDTDAVFLGCSFTYGSGLSDPTTKYSYLVADHFGLTAVNLAAEGGSNQLLFDRFTQLDCYENQLVVVQLAVPERVHYSLPDTQLRRVVLSHPSANSAVGSELHRYLVEVYNHKFLFYELLSKVRAMVTIGRAKKLRLVFWLIEYNNPGIYSTEEQQYFTGMPEFVPAEYLANYRVDRAEDHAHPGVQSQVNLASGLIKYIEKIYS